MLKRAFAAFMGLCMAVTLIPCPAFAADAPENGALGVAGSLAAAAPAALSAADAFHAAEEGSGRRPVTVDLAKADLRDAVCDALDGQGVTYKRDNLAVTLTASDLAGVTQLDLSGRGLTTIDGVQGFTALANLNVANNLLTDLAPAASLPRLTKLVAYGNRLTSAESLAGANGLTHLDLAKNLLKGDATAPLARLTGLTYLDLAHNNLGGITGLAGLTALTYLDLYDNSVHDLAPLAKLTALTHLDLGDNNETSDPATMRGLDALDGLINLTYLDFSRNKTPAIVNHVATMKNLAFLQLQQNGITSVASLAGLTRLQTLILADNKLYAKDIDTTKPSIEPLYGLHGLQELNLHYCLNRNTQGLDGIVSGAEGAYKLEHWPELRKIDVTDAFTDLGGTVKKLAALDRAGAIEAAYDWDDGEARRAYYGDGIVQTDAETGVRYVTYEQFGARADGAYDDYHAMVSAHGFASDYQRKHPDEQVEVRGTEGKAYHVFDRYDTSLNELATSVDWRGATIVIHDEDIEHMPTRRIPLLVVRSLDGGAAYDARYDSGTDRAGTAFAGVRIDTKLKAGSKLPAEVVAKFPAGYDRYVVEFYDDNVMQHIRSGSTNANGGSAMYDAVIARADGTLEHDVQWDFATLTRLVVRPIPAQRGHIRNATFVTCGTKGASEVPYGNGKGLYYNRNIQAQYTGNFDVSGITHRLGAPDDWAQAYDELSGSYYGLLFLQYTADVTVKDCKLWGRKFMAPGRSTYDLVFNRVIDTTFERLRDLTSITDEDRWSVVAGAYGKNLAFVDCATNRAGTHETVYDLTIKGCDLGRITVCGQGLLDIEDTTVHEQSFLNLRSDYGTTWNGTVRIRNCTHAYDGTNRPQLVYCAFDTTTDESGNATLGAYGYPLRFPTLEVDGLTVSYAENARPAGSWNYLNGDYFAIANASGLNGAAAGYVPATYWPAKATLNRVRIVDAGTQVARGAIPAVHLTATKDGSIAEGERDYFKGDVAVAATDGADDLTARLLAGEHVSVRGDVSVKVAPIADAAQTVSVTRKTDAAGTEVLASPQAVGADGVEATYAVPGTYTLSVSSTSKAHGWTGTRNLAFTIEDNEGVSVDPGDATTHTHAWGEPAYAWADDRSSCTATRTCSICGAVEQETAESTLEVVREATRQAAGAAVRIAAFVNQAFEEQRLDEEIPQLTGGTGSGGSGSEPGDSTGTGNGSSDPTPGDPGAMSAS